MMMMSQLTSEEYKPNIFFLLAALFCTPL